MGIDVDTLVATWKTKRDEKAEERLRAAEEQKERSRMRRLENAEWEEKAYRKKVGLALACIEGEYIPHRLVYWFNRDLWTVAEGLLLLTGYDPRNITVLEGGEILVNPVEIRAQRYDHGVMVGVSRIQTLAGLHLFSPEVDDILGPERADRVAWGFYWFYEKLKSLWESGAHGEKRYPPLYFIEWARRKNIDFPWLEWAAKNGLYLEGTPLAEKPLTSTERNTLLTIIAALCNKAGINSQEKGVAPQIVEMAQLIGVPLDPGTVLAALKKIPDAVSRRQR